MNATHAPTYIGRGVTFLPPLKPQQDSKQAGVKSSFFRHGLQRRRSTSLFLLKNYYHSFYPYFPLTNKWGSPRFPPRSSQLTFRVQA